MRPFAQPAGHLAASRRPGVSVPRGHGGKSNRAGGALRPAWLPPCVGAGALRQLPLIPGWEREWERDSLSGATCGAPVLASASPGLRRWSLGEGGGVVLAILTSEGSLVRTRLRPQISSDLRKCLTREARGSSGVA